MHHIVDNGTADSQLPSEADLCMPSTSYAVDQLNDVHISKIKWVMEV